MVKSDFQLVQVDSDRIFLVDKDIPGTRSVTNDAENVVLWAQANYPRKRVIYRDTLGGWDEIVVAGNNNAVTFLPYDEYVPDVPEFVATT